MPKIEEYPVVITPTDNDQFFVEQDGVTKRMTRAQLLVGWEEMDIDGGAFIAGSDITDGGEYVTVETASNLVAYDGVALDSGATEEKFQFAVKPPRRWDRGPVKFRYEWTGTAGASPGDTVEVGLMIQAIGDGDPLDSAWGTPQVVSDTLLSTGDFQVSPASPELTVSGGPAANDTLFCLGYRNTDGTDDMAEDCVVKKATIMFKLTNEASDY